MSEEILVNLHMHTYYSDGFGSHAEIAQAALKAGVDVVIVTDHNVWVAGPEDYHTDGEKRVLLLIGEEIHDQGRPIQKNHLLVLGAERELATYAQTPQLLIDNVNKVDGLSFLAHPFDPAAPVIGETDITWVDWQVTGYTGIELWNQLSEFKTLIKSKLQAAFYVFFPHLINLGPPIQMLKKWDELLIAGKKVVAVGGSDAHNLPFRVGFWKVSVFPYKWHFQGVNTHILTNEPLTGDIDKDKKAVYSALKQGHAFIGYDLPHPTRGFRFSAHGKHSTAQMGDEVALDGGVTFKIHLPVRTECCLLRNGKLIGSWRNRENCTQIVTEPGIYRVEVYLQFAGRRRGWIFSNPIYVR